MFSARDACGAPRSRSPPSSVCPAGLPTLPPQYRRQQSPGLIGAAAAVVIAIANPFADALLATGTYLGLDPYLMIQSVLPLATEAPEFVIVAVLVVNRRPAQGLALFLASSVSQWTLGLGAPIAYLAGGGGPSMPLAGREQVELGLTIALTLFAVAALAALRPERADAAIVVGVMAAQFLYPTSFVWFVAALVLLVFAIDLLFDRRCAVRPLYRAVFARGAKVANWRSQNEIDRSQASSQLALVSGLP
jgi:cation:H+ antiporter